MEVYLRLMFLKFRYRLGYESLCREVADSITWRRFCRIPLDGRVPHPTTLMKLTSRCGTAAVDGCNEALLAKAAQAKLLRTTRLRADTTVVPADVAYPTDSGLLAKAVRRIAAAGRRVQAAGGAARTTLRDRSRSAGRRAREIGAKLRLRAAQTRDEAQSAVRRITGELAGLAEKAATEAEQLLANARRALRRAIAKAELAASGVHDAAAGRRRGRLRRAVNDLTDLLTATRRIAAQTRQRLSGTTPDGATRRVSLHDADARPIAKGRLGKPVEFGYKAQVVDNDDGVVLDHTVERGNPADAPQLAPAVGRVIRRTRRRPRTVTADRGYGEAKVEGELHDLGVRTVVIPRKGRPGKARQAHERGRAFRRTVKWRTGSEARISTLKRGYGWDRTRLDDLEGARIWTGHGVLAHNLVKISALAA
jgi:IS5 family transposase